MNSLARMCDYADFDKQNLFRHLQRYHPETIDDQAKASELDQSTYENIWINGDPNSSRPSGNAKQGCYNCEFCGLYTFDRADLNLHLERFHHDKMTEPTKKCVVSEEEICSADDIKGKAAAGIIKTEPIASTAEAEPAASAKAKPMDKTKPTVTSTCSTITAISTMLSSTQNQRVGPPSEETESSRTMRSEKSIKCGYCPVMFYTRSRRSLYQHIQTVHGKGRRKKE